MKRYWGLAGLLGTFFLVAFLVIDALAVIATRPVPLLAETVMVLAGASPLGWTRALVASAVGSIPPALLYAFAGASAQSAQSFLLVFAAVTVAAGAFWLLGQILASQAPRSEGSSS
jgi:uncharacterized membrane protein YdjX (TVP38/TMEM64 family)